MDVGTRLEPHALTRLMRPFLLGEPVAAVGGTTRVGRTAHPPVDQLVLSEVPFTLLGGMQAVEQLRDRVHARLGWNPFGGELPEQGSVLVHRREQLLELDGYRTGVADPDRDLVMRLRARVRGRFPTPVPAMPDAVAWTVPLDRLRSVARERSAVHRRRLDELLRSRRAAADAQAGATGKRARVVLAALALAPVMELLGYALLTLALLRGGLDDPFVPLFLLAVPGYALLLSLWAVALEWAGAGTVRSWRDATRLGAFAVAEQLGYRQRMMWARLGATADALLSRPREDATVSGPSPAPADLRSTADQVRVR
jgi:cellulose synthase/poly-beta-1,6-N-acetylglucosamine synthase-like glycosyltransferase